MIKPHRRLTDPMWLLQYAVDNPKRAIKYGVAVLLIAVLVTVSLAIQAIPVWIGGVVAGGTLIAGAREPVRRVQLLWTASEQSTGAVTGSVVSVSGEAVAADNRRLTSELQEIDCLAYEYTKAKTENRSEEGKSKSTRTSQRILPFYVDDGSGPVLVDASGGTVSIHDDETNTSGTSEYKEGVLQAGDKVTVYGELQDNSQALPDETDCVVTTGPEYGDVVVTDRSGAWLIGGQVAYALGWLGVGAVLVVASIAVAGGLVSV